MSCGVRKSAKCLREWFRLIGNVSDGSWLLVVGCKLSVVILNGCI